jgi:hypothetical protein
MHKLCQKLQCPLIELEDPPHPAMLNSDLVTGLDHPREFPGREEVREGEPDDLVLYMERHAHCNGDLPRVWGRVR